MAGEVRLTFDPDGRPVFVPVSFSRHHKDEGESWRSVEDDEDVEVGMFALFDSTLAGSGEERAAEGDTVTVVELGSHLQVFDGDCPPRDEDGLDAEESFKDWRGGADLSGSSKGASRKRARCFTSHAAAISAATKDAAPSSHRTSLAWKPRVQLPPTWPVSSAPGVRISPSNQARAVSSAPGALSSVPVTCPASSAPEITTRQTDGSSQLRLATKVQSLPIGSTTSLDSHAHAYVVDQPLAASSQNSRDGIDDSPANDISPHGDMVRGLASSRDVPNRLGSTNLSKINPLMVDKPLPCQVCNIAKTVGPPDDGPIIPLNSEIAQPGQAVTNLKAITSSLQSEPIQTEPNHFAMVGRDQLHDETQVHGHTASDYSDHDIDPFCNPDHPPENYPLSPNFSWIFMHGCWSLVPIKYSVDVANKSMVPMDLDKLGQLESGLDADPGLGADPESGPRLDNAIQDYDGSDEDRVSLVCPEDSESDFEEKIQRLFRTGQTEDLQQGTRRSERPKKPSSRWNEEAGFIPQPPRSTKKNGILSTTPVAPEPKKAKLEEPVNKIRRSLDFLVYRATVQGDIPSRPSSPGDI